MTTQMKWPAELLLIRHAESAYNVLKHNKASDPDYLRFLELFDTAAHKQAASPPEIQSLARTLQQRYALGLSDRDMPITPRGGQQARLTGAAMRAAGLHPPDIIFVSPYLRTKQTLELLQQEWPELRHPKIYEEERIREKDHGLALIYNDWRIYQVLHPDQAALHDLVGEYDYRYLNGENIPDVRQRNLSWIATLTREFAGKRVLAITHHLTILATRANFERLSPAQFLHLDEHEKPVNCGVTSYIGNPQKGISGKLELVEYNKQYYPDSL
jgi:broad specificity phosphatase PhoE